MLFPTLRIAEQCRSFMQDRSTKQQGSPVPARLIHLLICSEDKEIKLGITNSDRRDTGGSGSGPFADLHIVLFPAASFPLAKEFWQHSGMGISSRLAEYCLSMLPNETVEAQPTSPVNGRFPIKGHNKHYSVKGLNKLPSPKSTGLPNLSPARTQEDDLSKDHSVYLEERYGRNLPISYAASAKRALRRRISGVLIRDNNQDCQGEPCAGAQDLVLGPSSRGIVDVSENDVYLYPTGMSAIWNAHNLALSVLPPAKSVCFGSVYCAYCTSSVIL